MSSAAERSAVETPKLARPTEGPEALRAWHCTQGCLKPDALEDSRRGTAPGEGKGQKRTV